MVVMRPSKWEARTWDHKISMNTQPPIRGNIRLHDIVCTYVIFKAKSHDWKVSNMVWTKSYTGKVYLNLKKIIIFDALHKVYLKKNLIDAYQKPKWRACWETPPRIHAPATQEWVSIFRLYQLPSQLGLEISIDRFLIAYKPCQISFTHQENEGSIKPKHL